MVTPFGAEPAPELVLINEFRVGGVKRQRGEVVVIRILAGEIAEWNEPPNVLKRQATGGGGHEIITRWRRARWNCGGVDRRIKRPPFFPSCEIVIPVLRVDTVEGDAHHVRKSVERGGAVRPDRVAAD